MTLLCSLHSQVVTNQEPPWPGCLLCLLTHRTRHIISATSSLFPLYLFPLISCEWPGVFYPPCLAVKLPKSHFLKALQPPFSCEWAYAAAVASLIGPGEGEAALPRSTWALKGAWVQALIYHVGWWFAVRGLGAVCLSIRGNERKKAHVKVIKQAISGETDSGWKYRQKLKVKDFQTKIYTYFIKERNKTLQKM